MSKLLNPACLVAATGVGLLVLAAYAVERFADGYDRECQRRQDELDNLGTGV